MAENKWDDQSVCYYLTSGVFMRKWRPHFPPTTNIEWVSVHQVVVPVVYRQGIMKLLLQGI